MKFLLPALTLTLLVISSTAFAVTTAECQAAWKASSAYQSCSPGWGTKAIGNKCGIYVHCKKPNGIEVANGSYNAHYDQKSNLTGSDYSVFYSVDELRKLNNCDGNLKLGSC